MGHVHVKKSLQYQMKMLALLWAMLHRRGKGLLTHANLTISIFLCHIAEKTVVDGEAKNGDTKEETVEEFKSRMNKLMTN